MLTDRGIHSHAASRRVQMHAGGRVRAKVRATDDLLT